MKKFMYGFTLIETLIGLSLMSLTMILHGHYHAHLTMQKHVLNNKTDAYHIVDNFMMFDIHNQIFEQGEVVRLIYNTNYEIDEKGTYMLVFHQETSRIHVYIKETMREILVYDKNAS